MNDYPPWRAAQKWVALFLFTIKIKKEYNI